MESLPKILMGVGGALLLLGLVLHFGPGASFLGRLPGDIHVERPGFRFHFPIVTCLLLSAGISALLWVLSRFR